jgi:hypothetical protein
MLALLFTDLMDSHNVPVFQPGRSRRLDPKPANFVGGGEGAFSQELYRDEAVQADLPRTKHNAHSPTRQLFQKFVIAYAAEGIGVASRFNRRLGSKKLNSQTMTATSTQLAQAQRGAAPTAEGGIQHHCDYDS